MTFWKRENYGDSKNNQCLPGFVGRGGGVNRQNIEDF